MGELPSPKPARVFEVTAITHRNDAIFHDIFPVGPEHLVLFSLGMEGEVLAQLKQLIPQLQAIHVPVCGSGNLVYVQIKKNIEGLGVNAALAALGADILADEKLGGYKERGKHHRAQLGPRPFYLVNDMDDPSPNRRDSTCDF